MTLSVETMENLLEVEEADVRLDFELEKKCKTTIHLTNLLQTVSVAFRVQTTSPHRFAVNPPSGFIAPQANFSLEIILKPSDNLPKYFPLSKDVILLKTMPAPKVIPGERVPKDWFASRKAHGTWDYKLNVIYTGSFLLRHVVEHSDLKKLQKMVNLKGMEGFVNEADEVSGRSALHMAAAKGSVEVVKLLLNGGADKASRSCNGQSPLHEAVVAGHFDVVVALLDTDDLDVEELKDTKGWNPLHLAVALDQINIVDVLLQTKIDPNVRDNEGMSALHIGAGEGYGRCVKALLEGGADVDAVGFDGCTALFRAASKGYVDVVNMLLDFGGNKRVRNKKGQIASDVALENGHMEIVELLEYGDAMLDSSRSGDMERVVFWLQKGVGLNFSDQLGWTSLHCAAFKGHQDLVVKLLELGADMEAEDCEGHTPLHCAAYGGHSEIIGILVENGAKVEAQTVRHATPLMIERACNFPSASEVSYREEKNCKCLKLHCMCGVKATDADNHKGKSISFGTTDCGVQRMNQIQKRSLLTSTSNVI